MNKTRRKALKAIVEAIEEQKLKLAEVIDEESDAFDNLPESIQESDRGAAMEEGIDNLDDALESLDDLLELIQDVIGEV